MVTLQIDNSLCCIYNLNIKQFNELRVLLSYRVAPQQSYFSSTYGQTRYLLDKRGTFGTGLLYIVENYLKKSQINYVVKDVRKRPEARQGLFTLSLGVTPYPEQINASQACLERHRGIIVAPTGFGKSVVVALIIEALQVPTLVVVPTLELKRQLSDTLRRVFGSLNCITVENVDALDPSKEDKVHQCVIVDEFHHSGASTYRKLNKTAWRHIYYKFGMTATPFRSQDHERLLLESVLSKVIYRVDYQDAVSKGYIVPLEAFYIELPKVAVRGEKWAQVYSELVINRQDRNLIIEDLHLSLSRQGKSTLTLVKEIRHGEILSSGGAFLFVNGKDEETKHFIGLFNARKVFPLIGTTGVLGEGVDTKPAEYIIIAGLGKSKNAFMQQCGRGFRTYPGKESCKVILFYDKSHKWTCKHFNAQCKFLLDEYGVKPIKLVV